MKPLTSITHLYVCASMTRDSEDIGVSELAAAHRRQGYSAIGVHYVIRRDGTLELGRPTHTPGAMSADMNPCAIQVCLIGGLNDHLEPYGSFTAAQLETLDRLHQDVSEGLAGREVERRYGPEAPLKPLR